MAHPMKGTAADAHTAKMRKMTEGYGSASGPQNNIASPTNRLKGEGGEKSIGFGVDSDAPRSRADRSMRSTKPANPIATYAKGGRVKKDDGGSVSAIEEANKNQAAASPQSRARGGRTGHKKGSTHVNVIVAPQGGAGAGPGGMPPMMPVRPVPPVGPPPGLGAGPPPGMPPGGPPMGARPPMPVGAPPPGGMPPGMMPPRAAGGRIARADGGKVATDEPGDRIKESLKEQGLKRASGGKIPHVGLEAGSMSGEGRLQKTEAEAKRSKGERPQVV